MYSIIYIKVKLGERDAKRKVEFYFFYFCQMKTCVWHQKLNCSKIAFQMNNLVSRNLERRKKTYEFQFGNEKLWNKRGQCCVAYRDHTIF